MNHEERRHAPRRPVSVHVEQHVEGRSHHCFATCLSLTGLFMQRPIGTFVRHSASTTLAIRLPDGDGEPVWASAEVVYDCFDARFHGSALRFTAMSERDRARLHSFLTTAHAA